MSDFPDLSKLTVTAHAAARAAERLRIEPAHFRAWVAATCAGWYPVNAAFFRRRGLNVSAARWLYHCTWTPSVHLCMPISTDAAILTVMDYPAPKGSFYSDAAAADLQEARSLAKNWESQFRALLLGGQRNSVEMAPGVPRPGKKDYRAMAAHRLLGARDLLRDGVVNHLLAEAGLQPENWSDEWVQRVMKLYAQDQIDDVDLVEMLRHPGRFVLLTSRVSDHAKRRAGAQKLAASA